MGHIVHMEFQTVRRRVTKVGRCPACKRIVSRSTTIENTVNPFNRNILGQIKSFEEVSFDVQAEADAWEPNFRHNTEKCR